MSVTNVQSDQHVSNDETQSQTTPDVPTVHETHHDETVLDNKVTIRDPCDNNLTSPDVTHNNVKIRDRYVTSPEVTHIEVKQSMKIKKHCQEEIQNDED